MPLQDGTPRERYNETRNSQGRPTTRGINWSVVLPVALAVALLISALGFFLDGKSTVTNAPANTPPSVQQPDTTPPVNGQPAR